MCSGRVERLKHWRLGGWQGLDVSTVSHELGAMALLCNFSELCHSDQEQASSQSCGENQMLFTKHRTSRSRSELTLHNDTIAA